jgi:hypothetical protein
MRPEAFPTKANKLPSKHVYLVASGDLRQSANETCWPGQAAMEKKLNAAIAAFGFRRSDPAGAKPAPNLIGHVWPSKPRDAAIYR